MSVLTARAESLDALRELRGAVRNFLELADLEGFPHEAVVALYRAREWADSLLGKVDEWESTCLHGQDTTIKHPGLGAGDPKNPEDAEPDGNWESA